MRLVATLIIYGITLQEEKMIKNSISLKIFCHHIKWHYICIKIKKNKLQWNRSLISVHEKKPSRRYAKQKNANKPESVSYKKNMLHYRTI